MSIKSNIQKFHFSVEGNTNKGQVRPRNEDYFNYFIPPHINIRETFGSLFVISDGVGGHLAGEVASAEAVNVLLQEYYFGNYSKKPPNRLKEAFAHAATHIFDLSKQHKGFSNMQCTLTALLLRQDQYIIAHAGDSKAFLLRSKTLTQLTKDHSLVAKLVRMGLVSKEQAKTHPYKHMLIRALGESPLLPIDLSTGTIQTGDVFCLITDGILEHLNENELREFLLENEENDNFGKIHKRLIREVNSRGGCDNMTILTVKVMEDSQIVSS
ncbi:serine/threonine protein phosphatase [Desulfosporosinus acidiphilus SJ4]|uniref:Serine/threonine protein phosphatase n=1 Tax=Desulfosporosinus acidiphilus (strain DSM 22704 / JCM 16185 / SJ4) TaxID=646529 RepID=I4D2C0_DESAJ|nr:protein phosphatase 2C domain-containing protein [Desulfosporosinus acidiphilus]AFM39944.1 serine/threonine protein phosphatase [Desulfosporosinus acidiphilus SJ4]